MSHGLGRTTIARAAGLSMLFLSSACATGGRGPAFPTVLPTLIFPQSTETAEPALDEAGLTAAALSATQTAAAQATPTSAPGPREPVFSVGVVVDTRTEAVTRDQALALVNEAAAHLKALVPVTMVMADFVEDAGGGATTEMLQRYMLGHTGALPNGVVILSSGDQERAKVNGSYGYAAAAPEGYRNSFVSPLAGNKQIYVAVIDYSYRYMPCGYGGSGEIKSLTAYGGECENHTGVACVQQNGYSTCSNAVGRLYMSTPTYFAASMIVHELLQPFAPGGSQDDYSTPECTARMGYPAGFRDLQEAQYHNDLCPFVYEDFLKSYQP